MNASKHPGSTDASARAVEIRWADESLTITVDGETAIEDVAWSKREPAVDLTSALEVPLSPTTQVTIYGEAHQRAKVLSAINPSDELVGALEDLEDEINGSNLDWEETEVGPDILIDGEPWAWLWVDPEWHVVPRGFRDTSTDIVQLSDWMSASMTGMVVEGGCVRFGQVAQSWMSNDIDGLQWIFIEYEPGSADELARVFFNDAFGDYDPLCFVDEAEGWVTDITVGEGVSDEVLGEALTQFRHPCTEHDRPDLAERLEMAGSLWRWDGTTFVREPETA